LCQWGGCVCKKQSARGAEFVVFELCGSCSELTAVIQELSATTKADSHSMGAPTLERRVMRINKIVAPSILLLFFAFPWACAQNIPMGIDVFAEFGPSCLEGNVHSGASGQVKCEAGRFFGGARLRLTRHDAFEA